MEYELNSSMNLAEQLFLVQILLKKNPIVEAAQRRSDRWRNSSTVNIQLTIPLFVQTLEAQDMWEHTP